MHIQKSHRHYVAAPLFAAVLLLSTGGAYLHSASTASVMDTSAMVIVPGPFSLPSGEYGVAGEKTVAALVDGSIELQNGSLILASTNLAKVTAHGWAMAVFGGAVWVDAGASSTTLVALSAPVLIRHANETFLLPMGYQVVLSEQADIASLRPQKAPAGFLREHLLNLSEIAQPAPDLPAANPESVEAFASRPLSLLPGAGRRDLETWANTAVARLRFIVETNPADPAEFMQDALWNDLAMSSAGREASIQLLGLAARSPSFVMRILPMTRDHDLSLLGFFHPDLRTAAWVTMDPAAMETQDLRFAVENLPKGDGGQGELSPILIDRWEIAAAELLASNREAAPVAESLVSSTVPWIRRLEQEYPERFERYADALRTVLEPVQDQMLPETQETLASLEQPQLPVFETQEPVAQKSQPSSASSSSPVAHPEALLSQTRTLLSGIGAVYSTVTTLSAREDGTVLVEGILFSSRDGEHVYSFVLNPAAQTLTQILRDGKKLPFDSGLEGFGGWVR